MKSLILSQINEWLQRATVAGLLDDLTAYVHPDVINQFCDGVESMSNDQRKTFDQPITGPAPLGAAIVEEYDDYNPLGT